jgi:hypothetical protein
MPTHDRLCKQFLLESLDPVSQVAVHMTVAPQDDQYVDNFCVPRPDPPPPRSVAYLGPLREMVRETCMIESSSRPPSIRDIDNNQRKQLNLQRQLIKENKGRYVERPRLWLVSVGYPRDAIKNFGFLPSQGWPRGFHETVAWARTGLVVLSELADTPETLALPLLGSKSQRKAAMKELVEIAPTDAIRRPLLDIVARVRYFIEQATDVEVDAEERAIMTELGKQWEKYKADFVRRTQEEVRAEFRREGDEVGAVQALRDGVLAILRARHLSESKATAKRVKTCSDQAKLKRWLERAAVAKTPSEVFAES